MLRFIFICSVCLTFTSCGSKTFKRSTAIDEYQKIEINGTNFQFWIRGESIDNPILLFLHGGPGEPHMHEAAGETNLLKDRFTVVRWDQRGAGASFKEGISPESLTIEQMKDDTHKVIQYLLKRFDKKKLYLLGHSWGSFLGLRVVKEHPDLVHGFIAVGLVTDMIPAYKSMKIRLLKAALPKIKEAKGKEKVKLEKAFNRLQRFDIEKIIATKDFDAFLKNYFEARTELGFPYSFVKEHGGNPHISSKEDIEEYKKNIDKGFEISQDLFYTVLTTSTFSEIKSFPIPIFTLLGRHDYNVDPYLAEQFIKSLDAPCKKTYWFEKSAHMIMIEEPKKFRNIMSNDVLDLKACRFTKIKNK